MSAVPGRVDSHRSSRELAMRVIGALRQGSNCLEAASQFSAGRESLHAAAERLLEDLALSGGSAVRWVKGAYGSGKTHTFACLLAAAHKRNWVASYVEISGRGQGCELNRFEEVYAAIIRNSVTPELAQATDVLARPGAEDGWRWLLDGWVESLRRQAGARAGGDLATFRFSDVLDTTMSELRRAHGIHGAFGSALRAYARAKVEGDTGKVDLLLDWFAGVDVFKLGARTKADLRAIGILDVITRRNAKAMLRQLTAFTRYRGYKGFLVLVDEVENVMQYTPASRRAGYTILRELIDNVDERHGMARSLVYLSGTPDLFEGEKGITEHEALASRVILSTADSAPNPAAALIDLGAFPVKRHDLLVIGRRIAELYRSAYPDAGSRVHVDDHQLSSLMSGGADPSPRRWVRLVVDLLDRMSLPPEQG